MPWCCFPIIRIMDSTESGLQLKLNWQKAHTLSNRVLPFPALPLFVLMLHLFLNLSGAG